MTEESPDARVRAWFEDGKPVETAISLAVDKRATANLELPLTATGDRSVLHVTITNRSQLLWKKDIRTMIVSHPPQWPKFGAVETKLRYDAPISVKDTQTGALSSMDYNTAWDPKFNDVVVFLPNGSRFVFWRGSTTSRSGPAFTIQGSAMSGPKPRRPRMALSIPSSR